MRCGDHIRPCVMDARVDRERRNVDLLFTFNDFAFRVHQNQIGNADMPEMRAEGIDPEVIRPFRIARRDMPGHTLVETELRKKTKAGGQALFAMTAFLPYRCELWNRGNFKDICRCDAHCTPHPEAGRIIAPCRCPPQKASSVLYSPVPRISSLGRNCI